MKTWEQLERNCNREGTWVMSRTDPMKAVVIFICRADGDKRYELKFWVDDKIDHPWAVGRLAAELLNQDLKRRRNSLDSNWVETRIRCAALLLRK